MQRGQLLLITDPDTWVRWWRGLVSAEVVEANSGVLGNTITATWRALAGYKITIKIVITAYQPGKLISFNSSSDLVGSGSWEIIPLNQSHTNMAISWRVATAKPWMNRFAFFLRPIFVYSHQHLMKQGERGLNDYVTKQN